MRIQKIVPLKFGSLINEAVKNIHDKEGLSKVEMDEVKRQKANLAHKQLSRPQKFSIEEEQVKPEKQNFLQRYFTKWRLS